MWYTFHLGVEGFRMGWWTMCKTHPRWRKNLKFFFKSSRPSPGMFRAPPRLGGRRVGSILGPSKMGTCSLSTLKLKVLGWDGGRCAKFTLGGAKNQSFFFLKSDARIWSDPFSLEKTQHAARAVIVWKLRNDKVNSLLLFGNRTKINEKSPLFGGPYRNSDRQFFYSPFFPFFPSWTLTTPPLGIKLEIQKVARARASFFKIA